MRADRPAEAVDEAVEGRWALCVAICASARAVFVRPGARVSCCERLQTGDTGLLTLAVRCVFLNLPAQLGDVAPPAGAAGVVELPKVAQRLVALGLNLRQRE